jgi:hypothetical protein
VDSPTGKERSLTNEEWLEELGKLVDKEEKIEQIWYCTHPLYWWQMSKIFLHHAYIVFKTDQWWWSIEKNVTGITIQRSKQIEFVRDKYRKVRRQESITTGIGWEKKKTARNKTVKKLIEHIHDNGFLNEEYRVLLKISQEFADNVYEFL